MATTNSFVPSSSGSSTRDRSLSCTHLQLTRLYDDFGGDQCSICHRRPQLGWLYRCTQDFNGFLPASDIDNDDRPRRFERDAHLYTLSAAITKAAANGDYTDQELHFLWKQKLQVRQTIQQARPETSSTASTASSSQYSLPASTTTSTIRSSDSDPDTESSQLSDYLQPCRGPLQPIREVHSDLENGHRLLKFAKPTLPTLCSFKVCQTCRPIYQQRAWQSIDGVLKGPYRLPPKHELANRRISDVNVVKRIGLRSHISAPYARKQFDVDDDDHKRKSRTQFRDIVQQLLTDQERAPEDYEADAERQAYVLESAQAAQNLFQPWEKETCDNTISRNPSRTSSRFLSPLYHRRGSERLTSIQPPFQKAESEYGESRSSSESLAIQNNRPCSAVIGLKVNTAMANEERETTVPVQKTPTESIRESLCRFGGLRKTSARFAID